MQMQAFVRVEPPPASPTFGRGLYHYDRNTEFDSLYPSITRGYNILHSTNTFASSFQMMPFQDRITRTPSDIITIDRFIGDIDVTLTAIFPQRRRFGSSPLNSCGFDRSVNPCGMITLDWNNESSCDSENWFSSAFCLPRTRKHRFPFDQQGFKFVDIHQIYKKNKMFNSALANQQRYIVFCLCMMSRMIFYNFIVIGLLLIRFFDHYRQRNGIQ